MNTDLQQSIEFRAVVGALRSSIEAHGPITKESTGSAAKRIVSAVAALPNERIHALEACLGELWHDALKGKDVSTTLSARVRALLGCGPTRQYVPMPPENGGGDFTLVAFGADGKPRCIEHGAMNKVSPSPPGYWRCISTSGAKHNPCRAGCMERAAGMEGDR